MIFAMESDAAYAARRGEWHPFFALFPRHWKTEGDRDFYIWGPCMRRSEYYSSYGGGGWSNWYRPRENGA